MKQRAFFGLLTGLVVASVSLLVVGSAAGATHYAWNESSLNTAMGAAGDGDEVVLYDGTYDLRLAHGYYISTPNITIRSESGNRDAVILYGGGMNNTGAISECLQFNAPGITVKDLTIEGFYRHAIHYQSTGDGCVVDNVVMLNNGEQHVKGTKWNDDLVIRNCLLYQTEVRQCRPGHISPCNYIGGIDLHGARNAHIHDNVVMDIIGSDDGGDGGIFLWNESQNCLIERNVVIGCCKQIELGNPSDQDVWQVQNTIVRNNFILRRPNEDIGIELCYTKDCKVYNNTIYSTGAPGSADWGRTIHIWDNVDHPTTNLDIQNNIILGGVLDNSTGDWSAGAIAAMGNIVDTAGTLVTADWFVDPDNLDLHLTALAAAAIDAGASLADVLEDFDEELRPYGASCDLGADEYVPEPASVLLFGVAGLAAAARRRRGV